MGGVHKRGRTSFLLLLLEALVRFSLRSRKLGSFSNDDGDGSENVTIKMNSRFLKHPRDYSNCFKCQMLVTFPGVEFLETADKFRKRKKNSSSCICVLPKTGSHQEISRPCRAVTAKKCTKKV